MPERDQPVASHARAWAWWTQGDTLRRVVTDLLASELAQMRPGRPPSAPPWADHTDFVRDLGADSLDLMGLGTALVEALHLHHGLADDRLLARPSLGDWIASARAGLEAMASARPGPHGGTDAGAGAGADVGSDAGADAAGLALTFRTSGSAGTPRRCTHRLATLEQEVAALAPLVGGRRRILSAVPSHHIYGFLFTVLLPQRLAVPGGAGPGEVEVIDVRQAGPAALSVQARAGDLVVAHPGWWEAAARLVPAFPADIVGVTSTAPCPDPLAAALADAGLRLLQVYGSSETGGVGWRERAGDPFILLPHWTRTDDPAALDRTLPDRSAGRYPLQDRLDWLDAKRFQPAGRLDAAVQVGGTNVFPAYVAEVLALHPQVRDVAVRLMRPDEGNRLKALVVAEPDADVDALRAGLPVWAAERLTTPERPVAWTFGPRLPRQASGKPADWIIDAQ
jgi:4-coumarate--CoA ligase (photoactive yellow protein activation family)